MRRFVRGFGWLVAAVLAPGTVLAVVILLLVRTQPGHEYLLRVAVRQLSGEVNGQVEVGGVQAGSILSGFRLHGLTIRDAGGRPVIEADSLDVRYSFPDLIRRNIVLVPARIWAPRLTIEWGEQGVPSNIETLFRARGPAGRATGRELRLLSRTSGRRNPRGRGRRGPPGSPNPPARRER